MSKFDLIMVRATKVIGLALGSSIMIYETVADHTDRPYLYAAALLMMGLQIAETVDKAVSAFGRTRSTSEVKTVPQPEPEGTDK